MALSNMLISDYSVESRSQARTTVRMMEGLVRLAQAHARLMMRAEVAYL